MTGLAATVLDPVSRYLSLAKWISIGLLALLVFGAIGYGVYTVDSWHRAAQALPAMTAARDDAIKDRDVARQAKADAETKFVGTLDGLGVKFAALQTKLTGLQSQIDRDAADRQRSYNAFLETTRNVPNDAPLGSDGDALVRRSLLDILRNPDSGQLGRGDGSDAKDGAGAAMPGTAAGADNLPGRPAAPDPEVGKAVVPAAGPGARHGAKRTAEGRRSQRATVGIGGTKRTAAARHVRPALSDCVAVLCGPGVTISAETLNEMAQKRWQEACAAING